MDELSDFLARVQAKMAEQQMSQAEMARALGLPSQSALSNIFKGKRKLTFVEALEMERLLGLPRDDAARVVPIIGLASASAWNEAVMMPIGRMAIPATVRGRRVFSVQVRGDSLNRVVPDGGYVCVDPDDRNLYDERFYLIQNEDHEATVKQYRANPARFEPASTNPLHQPIMFGDAQIAVIGRVVWVGAPL